MNDELANPTSRPKKKPIDDYIKSVNELPVERDVVMSTPSSYKTTSYMITGKLIAFMLMVGIIWAFYITIGDEIIHEIFELMDDRKKDVGYNYSGGLNIKTESYDTGDLELDTVYYESEPTTTGEIKTDNANYEFRIEVNNDGTKMYLLDEELQEFECSNGFDLTTCEKLLNATIINEFRVGNGYKFQSIEVQKNNGTD